MGVYLVTTEPSNGYSVHIVSNQVAKWPSSLRFITMKATIEPSNPSCFQYKGKAKYKSLQPIHSNQIIDV